MATRPNKQEIAQMIVMSEMGETPKSIARTLGRSHNTIKKYLESEALADPQVQELVEIVKHDKKKALTAIWEKAANRAHVLLDDEKKLIPVIAAMDRSFQQLRLLQNESTDISDIHGLVVGILQAKQREVSEAIDRLQLKSGVTSDTDDEA